MSSKNYNFYGRRIPNWSIMPPKSHTIKSGTYIEVPAMDGTGLFRAYLARPAQGSGPGLILLQEIFGINENMRWNADRYAEEGYVVAVPDLFWRMTPGVELPYGHQGFEKAMDFGVRLDLDKAVEDIFTTAKTIIQWSEVSGKKVGLVGFCLGGRLAFVAACRGTDVISCSVSYYGGKLENHLGESLAIKCPVVFHFAGQDSHTPPALIEQIRKAMATNRIDAQVFVYPEAQNGFATPFRQDRYHKSSADMALQRSLTLLRQEMGPRLNLDAAWEQCIEAMFISRDAEDVMASMVADAPYINHTPTMMGGLGFNALNMFYSRLFLPQIPTDFEITPVSRTVGGNHVVDEFVASFTHDIHMDWILPGVKPTDKKVIIAIVAVVKFRGDKISHAHIYWDQASVLVQIGILEKKGLPISGAESIQKVLNETQPFINLIP